MQWLSPNFKLILFTIDLNNIYRKNKRKKHLQKNWTTVVRSKTLSMWNENTFSLIQSIHIGQIRILSNNGFLLYLMAKST